ncbi:MAG: histone deacetylase family protein [Thiohalomonadaceae bacterium]
MAIAYITHPACKLHEMGAVHPESPARLDAINDQLVADGTLPLLRHYEAPAVTDEQILRVHTAAYLEALRAASPRQGYHRLDADTLMNPYSLEAAYRAAGAAVRGVELVMANEAERAFCAVRPPGHHALADRAMGFCIFNNVAIGTAHALARFGLERVAIVDFDVHHGNGTETSFRDDPRVMLCSVFQHSLYPNMPIDESRPNIVHAPLGPGAYSEDFQQVVSARVLPALDRFAPELILMSAGFDSHFEDDLGQMNLLESDFFWITREVVSLARKHCAGRIVSVLEGGYALHALGRSVAAHIRGLLRVGGMVK